MKIKVSPAIIGFFVLGAVALGIIALLSFGSLNLFDKAQRFIIYFDESIQGLDVGSPVKIRGMSIGRVADVQIRHIPGSHQSYVAVTWEMNRDKVASARGPNSDNLTIEERYERLIKDGLRARLGVLGLATGMLYVELDILDPVANPAVLHPHLASPYLEIPAIPSAITQLQNNLSDILGQFQAIPFSAMATDVQAIISDLRAQLGRTDLPALVTSLTEAARSVHTVSNSDELKATLSNLNQVSDRLNRLLDEAGDKLAPLSADLEQTLGEARFALKEFGSTATSTRQFLNNQQTLGAEATQAIVRLGRAAEAVSRLADFLERNPTALFTGRPPEKNQNAATKN